jgi:hypothetical protein
MSETAPSQTSSIEPAPQDVTTDSLPERPSRRPRKGPIGLIWHALVVKPLNWVWKVALGTWVNRMLLALTLLCGYGGWEIGAPLLGNPPLPLVPLVHLVPSVYGLQITEILRELPNNAAQLTVVMSGFHQAPEQHWDLALSELTDGYRCPVRTSVTPGVQLRESYLHREGNTLFVAGDFPSASGFWEFADVNVCWQGHSPITTSGGVLAGALPGFDAGNSIKGTLTRLLFLIHPIAEYENLQTSVRPTATTFRDDVWSAPLSAQFDSLSSQPISFSASNPVADAAGEAWQARKAFIAGILVGIATGALVTLLTDVLGAVDETETRRKKRRRRYAEKLAEAKSGTDDAPAPTSG